MIKEMTPAELKKRLDAGEEIEVIDVREDWELMVSKLNFARQIVLHTLPDHVQEISKDKPVVFVCRSGARSMQAASFLAAYGWQAEKLFNLQGGILRWARDVDPTLPMFY